MIGVAIRLLAATVLAIAVYGCGGPAAPTIDVDADATVTASSLDFSTKQFTLPAGEASTIHFVNGSLNPHNIAIYTDSYATQALFTGAQIEQTDIVYEVPALPAGTYFFRCDLHPVEMNGTVTVTPVASSSP